MMKLRKSAFVFIIVFIGALLLPAGCGKTINRALPEQPVEFHTGTFVNPSNAEDSFRSIEYNKRIYIPFGALNGSLNDKDVGECLGYIVQDGVKMKDVIVCLLSDDPESNYLILYDTVGFMESPFFYRAVDTVNKEIKIPSFISDLDYEFWKQSD